MIDVQDLPRLILASGSPRRRQLLTSLHVPFEVIKPGVDESAYALDELHPAMQAEFLAEVKAQAVASHYPDALVIGSDTVVVIDGDVLGKPRDEADAFEMLKRLQGQTHEVISAIAVCHDSRCERTHAVTRVTMTRLSDAHIRDYIATGEPMDKAGAYAIQGYGSLMIPHIEGCYFNVVGMSLNALNTLFGRFGFSLLGGRAGGDV